MMSPFYELDITSPVVTLAYGVADTSVAIPALGTTNPSLFQTAAGIVRKSGSLWLVSVTGPGCYINFGAAATSANAALGPGVIEMPVQVPPGTVVHALQTTSAGTLSFLRVFLH